MKHVYNVKDNSLLSPWYKKHLAEPLLRFVPWHLPANIITILSNFCVVLALVFSVLVKKGIIKHWIIVPILIFIYASGDFLDGIQARRTNTSSRLGEFLDHFMDMFVNGMLLASIFILYNFTNPFMTALYFSISYLTLSTVYFEQHKTRVLVLEKIGPLEAIVFAALLITPGLIESSRAVMKADIIAGYSAIEIILAAMAAGAILTLKRSFKRTGSISGNGFAAFAFYTSSAALFASFIFDVPLIMAVITLYCGSYTGALQLSYLLEKEKPPADIVFPAYLGFCLIFNIPAQTISAVSIIYLGIGFFISLAGGFIYFRKEWLWKNPDKESVDKNNDAYTL